LRKGKKKEAAVKYKPLGITMPCRLLTCVAGRMSPLETAPPVFIGFI